MVKKSRYERERAAAANVRIKQITAEWAAAVPPERAEAFARQLEASRARGPAGKRPDMAPGTLPNPPRPGHEPRPAKKEQPRRPRY